MSLLKKKICQETTGIKEKFLRRVYLEREEEDREVKLISHSEGKFLYNTSLKKRSSGLPFTFLVIVSLKQTLGYLCIVAADQPDQNISQFFSQSNDFIHEARLNGGAVLIHW
jgi:protein-tyrosine phosphatase